MEIRSRPTAGKETSHDEREPGSSSTILFTVPVSAGGPGVLPGCCPQADAMRRIQRPRKPVFPYVVNVHRERRNVKIGLLQGQHDTEHGGSCTRRFVRRAGPPELRRFHAGRIVKRVVILDPPEASTRPLTDEKARRAFQLRRPVTGPRRCSRAICVCASPVARAETEIAGRIPPHGIYAPVRLPEAGGRHGAPCTSP